MTTVQELYAALASGPLTDVGLRAFDYVPGEAEWPAAYTMPPVVDYEGLANNWGELKIDVVVLVSAALDKHQGKLLPYQDIEGAQSISDAVLRNPSLGFDDVHLMLKRSRPLHLTEQSDYRAFGALFEMVARLG